MLLELMNTFVILQSVSRQDGYCSLVHALQNINSLGLWTSKLCISIRTRCAYKILLEGGPVRAGGCPKRYSLLTDTAYLSPYLGIVGK